MKSKYAWTSILLVTSSLYLFNCGGPADATQASSDCPNLDRLYPAADTILVKDSTYFFRTVNHHNRTIQVILATKDASGNFVPAACQLVRSDKCGTIQYKAPATETVYITYRFRSFIPISWKDKSKVSVKKGDAEECGKMVEKSKAGATRRGIVGDAGGSGTVSTTVDDK